ncbi:hypothetical protein [[Phormidium] sp. ETS-05]|uniref:hypothetical protein n=1 Tax=[Phormidium] sp. ETS-05 TaxID=222819 RepID=UPI0018EF02B9|nr:hypothetical protein [[Phormidium] sp. ETS-05]
MKCSCQEFEDNYPECTVCQTGKLIVAEEHKRKYILNNKAQNQICKIRIDGGVIDSQTQSKCDYMMVVCQSDKGSKNTDSGEIVYLIELKGKDLIKAVEQLTQTMTYFDYENNSQVFARAVVSKVTEPKSSIDIDSRVVKLRKMLKKYGGDFAYGSVQYDQDIVS